MKTIARSWTCNFMHGLTETNQNPLPRGEAHPSIGLYLCYVSVGLQIPFPDIHTERERQRGKKKVGLSDKHKHMTDHREKRRAKQPTEQFDGSLFVGTEERKSSKRKTSR